MVSALFLACAREAFCDDPVTEYDTIFNDHVEIFIPGYQGSTSPVLSGFPLLVRLSQGSPAGFDYARVDSAGKDIRFLYYDPSAKTYAAVPYEVDTWNTNGVSSLWVRLPTLNKNDKRKLIMYWAPTDATTLPANVPSQVWNGYTAVWHMNGTADSSANDIAASQGASVSAYSGVIGSALGKRLSGKNGPILSVSSGTAIDAITNDAYAITGWVRAHSLNGGTPWLYTTQSATDADGYGAQLSVESDYLHWHLKLYANGTDADEFPYQYAADEWVHFAIVHEGTNARHRVYMNGVERNERSILRTDVHALQGFALGGGIGSGATGTLNGDLDDVRIRTSEVSRNWCTNEYLQAVSTSYIAFTNFYSTGNPVYQKKKSGGDDPTPQPAEDVSVNDYAGTATFVPTGVGTDVSLTNFVALVSVWEGEPVGFVPADLPFGSEDIRFFDEQGNVLNFEIDTWDENDVSTFWVQVPVLTRSSRIIMCWGLKEGKTLPEIDPTDVWTDYAGVWHLSDETDATANGATATFGESAVISGFGAIGGAAGTQVSGQKGAILDITANEAIDDLVDGPFTVSGWVYLNKADVKYGALFSRASSASPAWGAQFAGGTKGDSSELVMQTGGSAGWTNAVTIDAQEWTRFDLVYATDCLTLYLNGVQKATSSETRSILNGSSGKLSIGGFVSAAADALGVYTLNGYIDEFRLRAGTLSADELDVDYNQWADEYYYTRNPVTWDSTAILQNRWRVVPTASKTEWNEGDDPATFTLGEPYYGESALSYQDRTTGEILAEMPTVGGDYRAVFTVLQVGRFSSLTYSINFRIRFHRPSHDLGTDNDRILLLNNDRTYSDGLVDAQSYSDTAETLGRPYWYHDVDSGYDYTSTSPYYNFCGGLRHTYWSPDGERRLWDLIDVRYGNTYNNADAVFEETGDWEEWDDGLETNRNYLAWNPQGGCLVDDLGLDAEGWHEYAAHAVMCNSLDASINSTMYTNGIGTIYFDCVNFGADDALHGYYRLVVEMATNAVDRETLEPSGPPTDEAIAATHEEWDEESQSYVEVVHNPYKFAGWQRLEMHVKVVNGSSITDAGTTRELLLELDGGGSYTNFYRVYVPVDFMGDARFRIRRTAVNPEFTLTKDVHSMILVDNVICSKPTPRARITPRGFYDETKVKRETVGYEGAFIPSYPSVSDPTLYARVEARNQYGEKVSREGLSSVAMHYRWRYLNQQRTDWMTVDFNTATLTSAEPISWPCISGDLEYWYEANQSDKFYEYADYSGLGIGLPGYSEEVTSVTNRAASYETDGRDWFTRIRDGKSTYGEIKCFVRKGDSTDIENVEMFVARDQIWRGCLQTTNAVEGGLYFRFEARNCQDDSQESFQFNTNCWYFADATETLPVSGSATIGTTNDWGWIPCDAATGHILFQIDEQTRALTVVHADWQDFNGWNDAHRDYFTGSSADDSKKSGVSAKQREYLCYATQWEEDCATNAFWVERFAPSSYVGYNFYAPFRSESSPNGFGIGEGMWVRGAYADTSEASGMAVQMAGQSRGYVQLTDPTVRPRGLESVRFSARIAQTVNPEDCAYYEGGSTLSDYTFLTRAAFDLGGNSNFTGNASLSLVAFYRANTACYEARWEQIAGNVENGSGMILGPKPRGQRLALYRWDYVGRAWQSTELYAATNSGSVYAWTQAYAPQAIPAAFSITNGLMPFYIGAYNKKDTATTKGYTLVIAAVHIPGVADASKNVKGNTADATMKYLADEQGWLYLVYKDTSANRLKRGTYGVLASNCEGVFVRPQYHEGLVSWKSQADTRNLLTQVWPGGSAKHAETANFYDYASATECVEDIAEDLWIVPSGRMQSFYETIYDNYNGFSSSVITQKVNVFTAPFGTETWTNVASKTLVGFGTPGVLQSVSNNFWSTDDVAVRIAPGGELTDVRTDVAIDNIEIRQWRGQNWLGNTSTERGQGGRTNFVYTSGWITDGALQLSPRRTPDNTPCSLRAPLCDGDGSSKAKRGIGLGRMSVWYRNAQANARLLVQIATNGVNTGNLLSLTLDPGTDASTWTTITNFDFSTGLYDLDEGVLECSPGLHGVVGVMRVIIDPTLRAEVKDGTDPDLFGSIEITQALFRDEPALDKGCWWGFNIRTIGDISDVEQRMYLPDDPIRSANPSLDEIGMSFALNNSVTEDCDPSELEAGDNPFTDHMPFLQTPTFASNIVGEVSFKARKYATQKGAKCAEVTLYGTTSRDVDKLKDNEWEILNVFLVSNTTYETYRYKTDTGKAYRAFRFAVTGVDGVAYPGPEPTLGGDPVRVLLDDVLVSEAVRARLAFRNVGAFRHYISKTTSVPNVPSTSEQPICGESWGIQAEVYAAMLGEEIDSDVPPRVRLHYYKSLAPWGYAQWKDKATAVSAWLTKASDTNGYYRSSATSSPDAVIPMATSGEIVQYMLEVVYTVVNSETGGRSVATNWLETTDWSVPSWYYPVDYNATLGNNSESKFAAFAIIDKIAPGWAWINEMNIFGQFGSGYKNSDTQKQFVEVVKPVDYDLDGWTLRMLAAKSYGAKQTTVLTNTVATFGRNNLPKQKAGTTKCNYMSFIVVGNPSTTLTGTEYDGAWNFSTTDNKVFEAGGVLGSYYPLSVQLVRPSGIIEHEVAVLGTNAYQEVASSIAWQYTSTNLVRQLKVNDAKSTVFAVPDDSISTATSVGITGEDSEREKSALCWINTMKLTPGELNEGQTITPDYPRPGGELIMVFAYVDSIFGHITQTVGSGTNTTEMQTITLTSGSEAGVDIKYSVDPWCELGSVKETEGTTKRTPVITKTANRQYTVNVAKGATKNVTVYATAQVDSNLRKYGLDEKNRYTPAVLHWLQTGTDAYGNPFYDTESGEIKLAKFLSLSGNIVTNMTLTQMYWLDMDPTVGEMYFRAGMVRPPSQVVVDKPTYDPQGDPQSVTNLRMGVYMSISNGNGKVKSGNTVWAPYVLRGLGNDELSWNYYTTGTSSGTWTSETFKVTGFLNSGLTSTESVEAWVPLRYFVFKENSFDSNFESEIDVSDPFSMQSPAYSQGWYQYVKEHGGQKPPVYLSWNIDERLQPITAEILAPTNRLDGTASP